MQKEVAFAMGITQPEYSQKKRGIVNSFSLEEFGRAADLMARKSGRPLIGFPWLDWQMQESVDRTVGGWSPSREG